MSSRTTIVLLVLLAIAGGGIWWHLNRNPPVTPQGPRLLPGLVTEDISRIVIRPERGDASFKEPLSLTRGEEDAWWMQLGAEPPVLARPERVKALRDLLREAKFVRELPSATRDAAARFGLAPGQRVVVEVSLSGGSTRTLALGAVVSESAVAALADDRWPAVLVDLQIQKDLVVDPSVMRERRLASFDATLAQSVRATFPKGPEPGFLLQRESGQWEIREPAIHKADQGLVMRLLTSLSALEENGSWEGAPPAVMVRYEIGVSGTKKPYVVEIGDTRKEDVAPGRSGTDSTWRAVSLAGLELIGQPLAQFRSRQLLHAAAEEIQDVQLTKGGAPVLHLKRRGPQLSFEPPDEWGWKLHKKLSLALDPSAQAEFLRLLTSLSAADFDVGPVFEPERVLAVRQGAAGSEVKLRFGRDANGMSPFARFGESAEGHVRTKDLDFLDRPYWELLARQPYTAAWFSLTRIEVEEVGKRKVVITATTTAGNEAAFAVTEPRGAEGRLVPTETLTPVLDKIGLLTVERFAGHGPLEEFGLDNPKYVIRWLDSGRSQGAAPDTRVGQWITWRVGAPGPDGLSFGNIDAQPGLVFKTSARDLDAFLSLLEWASR